VVQSLIHLLRGEILALRTSSLARNAGWMLVGQGLSLLLQAAFFVLLARLLGVREYGVFAGAFAFVGIATPFCTLGSGLLFMRYVSARPSTYAVYWGNILLSTVVAGAALAGVLYFVAPHLLNPASASIVIIVAMGNCVFTQLVATMSFVFQTFERLQMTAALNILTNSLRLVAVGIMAALLPHASARQWALVSMYISILAALVGFLIVTRSYGPPKFVPKILLSHTWEGLGFSLGWSAQSIYNDIDKTLLSHYGMNIQNGIYTMAYRIVDVATIPVTAVDAAALPRYFQEQDKSAGRVPVLGFRLARRAALIGLLMSGGLFVAAPLIPHLVGHGFTDSVLALRWLCILPAMRGIHQLTGSAITGMGFQRFRTVAQFSAAGLNLVLNLGLIPRYGWLGAAWASIATDGLLAFVNLLILGWLSKSLRRAHA
jgi:O-antigen/teichoic acid export membrane protein